MALQRTRVGLLPRVAYLVSFVDGAIWQRERTRACDGAPLKFLLLRSPPGLLAEDPGTGTMWGNFPQAYSQVGVIHAASASSVDWWEVL